MSANTSNSNKNSSNKNENEDSDEDQSPRIPRRDRTPSIVVQSLGISFNKDSNITESIELPGDEEDCLSDSNEADPRSSTSGVEDLQNDGSGGSKGSLSSLQNSSPVGSASPIRGIKTIQQQQQQQHTMTKLPGNNRRLSLNIGSSASRRQSLTVEGLSSFISPTYNTGSATGSLRNKVALKPGHSLMGWIRLASTAKDLSGTGGKTIEVTPEELAKHDTEEDCWVALKGNVYNVSTYLQYHPGGVEELMRGAGRDITDLFNEVHRWVNYETILAKCLVGPYKIESPLSPAGKATFVTLTEQTNKTEKEARSETVVKRDPTIAQKPPRRQSIALTVPSGNKYQSLLLNNNSNTNMNQIQQPPNYVIVQDKSCIKLKVQNLITLPLIRSRHLICDLNENMELNVSVILSPDWLYRVHLRLDQKVNQKILAELSTDDQTITIQLNKIEVAIWNKIGTSLDLNDSLCEMTLADKFFRPCKLLSKQQLTHDTYLFEFKLDNTLMYVPIGWHVLVRECFNQIEGKPRHESSTTDDYRVHKNYTPVLNKVIDNDGRTDESGFMDKLYFIIKIYPLGALTAKLNKLQIGDSVEISDYQSVDFDVESLARNPKHWFLFAAGTGITPFCRIASYLLSQDVDNVKSVNLVFFNKTQKDIILRDEFDGLAKKFESRFKVTHVLSDEQDKELEKSNKLWTGRRGRINKDLVAELIDSHNPDEVQLLSCGPRAFSQLTKTIVTELNLTEKLYVFHG